MIKLSEQLTIIIPCKNEKDNILKSLDLLNYQNNISNVKVIVCDASDDNITNNLLLDRIEYNEDKDLFQLNIMDGGLPGVARNKGFKIAETPYVLFIDSDIFILDPTVILRSVIEMKKNNLDLVTTKFRSDNGNYNYVYKSFDVIQSISKWTTPFCLGGYMLVRSDIFRVIGGFDETVKVAEDYIFSKQIKPKKFKRINHIVYTPPRRFESRGIFYMLKLMVGSFFNNRNIKFFKTQNDYWK